MDELREKIIRGLISLQKWLEPKDVHRIEVEDCEACPFYASTYSPAYCNHPEWISELIRANQDGEEDHECPLQRSPTLVRLVWKENSNGR